MLPAYLLAANVGPWGISNPNGTPVFFATYGDGGFIPATATSTDLTDSGTADIVSYAGGAINGTANAYALNAPRESPERHDQHRQRRPDP